MFRISGYYVSGMPPVEFTPDNEFCRFKAVGYIKMPTFSPEEGLVELVISKKDSVVRCDIGYRVERR